MDIDVVLLTKNSAAQPTVFRTCLDALYREIPVNRLIAVDAHSEDGTREILMEYPRVEFHLVRGNRAVARQYGVERVETEWFLFLDDDVILCRGWWRKAEKHLEPDVGLLWGWDVIANPHSRNRMRVMYYLRKVSEYELMKRNFRHRGGTHDTLVRREAVTDMEIPRDLHVFEDWYIKRHVEEKGYRAVCPEEVYCYHHLTPRFTLENFTLIARLQRKYGLQSGFRTVSNLALAPAKALAILLLSRDPKAASDQFKMYALNFAGRFIVEKEARRIKAGKEDTDFRGRMLF